MCHYKLIGKDGQKKWKHCPYRVETTLWHLQNDSDVYKQLEPYEDTYNELHQTYLCNGNSIAGKRHPVFKIIRTFCKTNRLTTEESNEVIKQFLIEKCEWDGDDSDTDSDTDSEDDTVYCLRCNQYPAENNTKTWCQECFFQHGDDSEDDEEEKLDYDDTCDCCVMGFSQPNKFGLCNCMCSVCYDDYRYCRGNCEKKNEDETNMITCKKCNVTGAGVYFMETNSDGTFMHRNGEFIFRDVCIDCVSK